ncbi:MAG: PilZ domain-containing protein [Candidatus Sulfotelmatobacter sp.]
MAAGMPELRTPVMILVDVSWEDGGALQKTRACMEDKSAGGACIRVKTPIAAGSRLKIQWRFEQFVGIVKYCRREGREYVVGVQREGTTAPHSSHASLDSVARENLVGANPQLAEAKNKQVRTTHSGVLLPENDRLPQDQEPGSRECFKETLSEIPAGSKRIEITPLLQSVSLMEPPLRHPTRRESVVGEPEFVRGTSARPRVSARDRPRRRREKFAVPRQTELRGETSSARKETEQERKPMAHKWLALAPWHNKQDDPSASEKENATTEKITNNGEIKKSAKENRMPMSQSAQTTEKVATSLARQVPAFQVELLPMEDIYRTAGIVSPRKGYSVPKVVEMLNSEHIRGLSKETKRAALLMALDAAGVTIEQVQRDGKARQNALDAYETEQKKQAEAEWARNAEEITHIQAELESIKAHYTARISRNMEALARDKARFNSWVTTKEQESQSMAEAVELCVNSPEPASAPPREIKLPTSAAAAGTGSSKPM